MWPVGSFLFGVHIPLVHAFSSPSSSTSPRLDTIISSPPPLRCPPSPAASLFSNPPIALILWLGRAVALRFAPVAFPPLFLPSRPQRSNLYSCKARQVGEDSMLGASSKAKKGVTVELGSMKHPPVTAPVATGTKVPAEEVWEVRPGGMLVQKRGGAPDDEPVAGVKPVPTIRVKVKHAGVTHEIYISAQASFGELKKMVAERTGLHPDDQKVMYKDKERDPKEFLDMAGVKDRSKLVIVDDPEARARRLIEERRTGHLEKAAKAVAAVTAEVDKIAPKVAALDASVRKGEKVAENDVAQVTELLMNELLKLDAVVADGDVKAQRRMQVKRVQKYVETLDAVTVKNAVIARKSGEKLAKQEQPPPPARQHQQPRQQSHHHQYQQQQPAQTRWEMFDLLSSLPSTSSASSTTTVSSTASSGASPTNRLDWMLF